MTAKDPCAVFVFAIALAFSHLFEVFFHAYYTMYCFCRAIATTTTTTCVSARAGTARTTAVSATTNAPASGAEYVCATIPFCEHRAVFAGL